MSGRKRRVGRAKRVPGIIEMTKTSVTRGGGGKPKKDHVKIERIGFPGCKITGTARQVSKVAWEWPMSMSNV